MRQSGHNLKISKYRRGCTLPCEHGEDTAPGEVSVRQATPEELAALSAKLGPLCPSQKARQIRDRRRSLAGIKQKKEPEEELTVEGQVEYATQEESSECITRKPTPVECVDLSIPLDNAQKMTPDDLTPVDAAKLLAAGVSKYRIMKLYGFRAPGTLYAKLGKWGLRKKEKEDDIDIRMNPTPEEKEKFFEEPQEPLPSIDLSAWELVDYAPIQRITMPYLRVGARGNGVIGNTDLQPGSYVQFRIDFAGRRIAVVPADVGQLLYNEENKRRRFSGGHLLRMLQAKGVALPARFRLEWNAGAGAWIGELFEKAEEAS